VTRFRLRDLLDEAVERAEADLRRRLAEEGRSEDDQFIQHAAGTVGLAAVKYADLSQNRITNYQFSFDRMLALQGNTAPLSALCSGAHCWNCAQGRRS
jgi:arginyl-tRNA synthetase